eukprot:evm.model.scf_892.1 EVM.evm.TU.scf_892.1   scf_892:6555-11484(-)
MGWMAEQEDLEARTVAECSSDEWVTCEAGFADVGVRRWCQEVQGQRSFSLPFRVEAVQQEVKEEQELLEEASLEEQVRLASQMSNVMEKSKMELKLMEGQERRLEWRAKRWQLAGARRRLWESMAAMEEAELKRARCISRALVAIFIDELKLLDWHEALQRYYCMGAGDWAYNLTDHICKQASRDGSISQSDLDWMLEDALQYSSCSHDPASGCLSLTLITDDCLSGTARVAVDLASKHALDVVLLNFKVAWPISLVITADSLAMYGRIFSMLLRLRHTRWVMDSLFWQFREAEKSNWGTAGVLVQRMRTVRLWYQDALSFVTMLQGCMQHQLVGTQWQKLQQQLRKPGMSLKGMQQVHMAHMEEATQNCFLSGQTQRLKK